MLNRQKGAEALQAEAGAVMEVGTDGEEAEGAEVAVEGAEEIVEAVVDEAEAGIPTEAAGTGTRNNTTDIGSDLWIFFSKLSPIFLFSYISSAT